MKSDVYFVYILSNKWDTVLYVGMTNDLERRLWQHRNKVYQGFTSRYHVTKLVYFEVYQDAIEAIAREKQIKAGSRQKKIDLINSLNPEWKDLSEDWE